MDSPDQIKTPPAYEYHLRRFNQISTPGEYLGTNNRECCRTRLVEKQKIDRNNLNCLGIKDNISRHYSDSRNSSDGPIATVIEVMDPKTGQYGTLLLHHDSAVFLGKIWKDNPEVQKSLQGFIKKCRDCYVSSFRFFSTTNFLYGAEYYSLEERDKIWQMNRQLSQNPSGKWVASIMAGNPRFAQHEISGQKLAFIMGESFRDMLDQNIDLRLDRK